MVAETTSETPVIEDKSEEKVKSDKEIIAEEEKAEKGTEDAEKTENTEAKEEESPEVKKDAKKEKPKKIILHTKDWEENKVYLYLSSRTSQIPTIYPHELMLETWLKLSGITFVNVDHKGKYTSRRGTLPFIEFNGEEISDIQAIYEVLSAKFEFNISSMLTQEEKNVEHAMIRMVENHLYWATMSWRSSNIDNTIKAYKISLPSFLNSKLPVGLLNMHFKFNVCKKIQKKVKLQGVAADIDDRAKRDLKVLSAMLADKKFLFGENLALLDLILFSHLAQLLMVDETYPCPLRDFLNEDCKNLVELTNSVKEKCWAEHWNLAVGETKDLNPHIPKPEPETAEMEDKEEPAEDKEKEEEKESKDKVDAEEAAPE